MNYTKSLRHLVTLSCLTIFMPLMFSASSASESPFCAPDHVTYSFNSENEVDLSVRLLVDRDCGQLNDAYLGNKITGINILHSSEKLVVPGTCYEQMSGLPVEIEAEFDSTGFHIHLTTIARSHADKLSISNIYYMNEEFICLQSDPAK